VARMILMSTYHLGEIPFKIVYLHGMVRNIQGKKFSKSLDNGIDPVEIIKQYGADALRMSLLVGVGAGNDLKFDIQKVKGYRNFANKIWNASRFVLQNLYDYEEDDSLPLEADNKNIVEELDKLTKEVTDLMEKFDFAHAAEILYHYFWHTFADKIIENAKPRLNDPKLRKSTQKALKTVLDTSLVLLHPFVPFVTEAVWQLNHKKLLMMQPWPKVK
jgi:valyl-tRNA synthetase